MAATSQLERAAAVAAVAVEAGEEGETAMADEEIEADNDEGDDDEEVPKRRAHDAFASKRQAVEGMCASSEAPVGRTNKFGLLSERAASSVRARAGIKKNVTEQSTGYTASIYKEIKKDEQQARVQNIFYELRAEGYEANEAAVLALERARGGDEEK